MQILLELFQWGLVQLKRQCKSLSAMVAISILVYLVVTVFGTENELRSLLNVSNLSKIEKGLIGLALFFWSCLLFTTFMPLGTVTVIIAGYVLGVGAGFIQFGSMLASSFFLYAIFDRPVQSDRIENYTQNQMLLKMFAAVSGYGICSVGLMRLIPIIPSAACLFISRTLVISFRHMMIGTLLVGWVRPVFFAYLGSQLTRLTL